MQYAALTLPQHAVSSESICLLQQQHVQQHFVCDNCRNLGCIATQKQRYCDTKTGGWERSPVAANVPSHQFLCHSTSFFCVPIQPRFLWRIILQTAEVRWPPLDLSLLDLPLDFPSRGRYDAVHCPLTVSTVETRFGASHHFDSYQVSVVIAVSRLQSSWLCSQEPTCIVGQSPCDARHSLGHVEACTNLSWT